MSPIRFIRLSLFTAGSFGLAALSAYALPIVLADQENTVLPVTGDGPISPTGYGQTFTPTLTGVDAVEYVMGDLSLAGAGGTYQVALLEGGPGGAILGTSLPVALPNGLPGAIVNFTFSSVVPLVPGDEYFMELQHVAGDIFSIAGRDDNPYPGGIFYTTGGVAIPGADAWFREGLSSVAVPEGGSTLLLMGVAAVALSAFSALKRAA